MIPAGNTSASFNVRITDDNIFEIREAFRLEISQTSELSLVIAATANQAFVTIIDDDRKFFDSLNSSVLAYFVLE